MEKMFIVEHQSEFGSIINTYKFVTKIEKFESRHGDEMTRITYFDRDPNGKNGRADEMSFVPEHYERMVVKRAIWTFHLKFFNFFPDPDNWKHRFFSREDLEDSST